ncbi:MAG TPA: FAD-dependent oxidoreductase [Alphaproteobacteria bacterium]|nr:FAD-dependent oxidoreductase [Alphaproteobacteria bacterium]
MAPAMALKTDTRTYRRATGASPRLQVDIAVLGSGIAGVSAALEAARLGRKVALIDAAPQLGGESVGSMIGTFCGLYDNGTAPRQVTHGIADEILCDLRAAGDAFDITGRRRTIIVQYRVAALQRWIEEAVRRSSIELVLGAALTAVTRTERRITALELATRYGPLEVAAAGFVDASGDAALAWTAGLTVREPTKAVYGSLVFTLEGVDMPLLAAFDRAELFRRLAEKGAAHGLTRVDGFVFAPPESGEVLVNMTHLEMPLDPLKMSRAVLDGRAQADRLVDFLRAEFPLLFAHARVRAYGLPGARQTRGIVGAYQLRADDVRAGTKFDDAVARCSWPIELHDDVQNVHWEEFGDGHMHTVPYRSLAHAEADNLLAAGRCIDADPLALSSVRVMGPCIAMGAAAAHALDLAGAGSVHQIDMAALRARLKANLEG